MDPASDPIPVTEIVNAPQDSTFDRYAVIEFRGQNAESFQCRVNDQDWYECTSPLRLVNLEMGTQTVSIRGLSSQGTPEPTPQSAQWNIISVFAAPNSPLVYTGSIPRRDPNNMGNFRIQCGISHFAYDDPIVYPRQAGRAHLHMFMGNEQSDFSSTVESMFTTGNSTCHGGTLNRSSYWIPSVLAPQFDAAGRMRTKADGTPVFSVVTPIIAPHVYYKSGVDDLSSIQPMPFGLRMIKGDPKVSGPIGEEKLYDIRWFCESHATSGRIRSHRDYSEHIPRCSAPDSVGLSIGFPECWNGRDLDVPDHASHMSRITHSADRGHHCPSSHPVALSKVSYTFFFEVNASNVGPEGDTRHWRLSSDAYPVDPDTRPGGYSVHADWFMAWHPEIMQAWTENCIQKGLDCSGGDLGNGWRLPWFREGTGRMPPNIIQGHPHSSH